MNKLILTLNAVGYKGENYEEEEIHGETFINKDFFQRCAHGN